MGLSQDLAKNAVAFAIRATQAETVRFLQVVQVENLAYNA